MQMQKQNTRGVGTREGFGDTHTYVLDLGRPLWKRTYPTFIVGVQYSEYPGPCGVLVLSRSWAWPR